LPHRWADAVHATATPAADTLADELDQAIVATPLRARRPLWWSVLGLLQILLAVTVVLGLAWTLVEIFFGAQDLIQLPMPHVGPFGLPIILLAGGLLLGWILALLARWFAAIGARRRGARARKQLEEGIGAVADRVIIDPMSAVLARHRETRTELALAAGTRR
ncbi:MAG: ABC transporter, partial [Nostocoides sp.]